MERFLQSKYGIVYKDSYVYEPGVEQTTGGVPGALPGTMPGIVQGTIPCSMPGIVPGNIPCSMAGIVPGTMPGSIPCSMPGIVPGSMPAAMITINNNNIMGQEAHVAQPPMSVMHMLLDHEGHPEWKCNACDFRDNDQDTVAHHIRLAHSKKGPVSLVHAVHRCSVCGFAAGTKRHVQVHIECAHQGQGGIISRSEGQNIDSETGQDESRSFDCRLCKFTCKRRGELKAHLSHHTPRADYVFKCMMCPYYVANKNELFSHLSVHGMDVPDKNPLENVPTTAEVTSPPPQSDTSRHFVCGLCPFESTSRAKLMHHRQFHRPRGLPFACPHCSYNVTRRHLLAQHLRTHGLSPTNMEIEPQDTGKPPLHGKFLLDDHSLPRSKSPSPSLTITPIMSEKEAHVSKINPLALPNLSEDLTKNLQDIPLVWVSKDNKFYKMFKCRQCPHVNLRKNNIQEHEKMHVEGDLRPGDGHTCKFCTYSCINAGVMTHHMKVHFGSTNKCHGIVDPNIPNEQQLHLLATSIGNNTANNVSVKPAPKPNDEKVLYYCQSCPARFFKEKEVNIHSRFHTTNASFSHLCDKCDFRGREESQILSHGKVHTPEYRVHTKTLFAMHPSSPTYPPVADLSVSASDLTQKSLKPINSYETEESLFNGKAGTTTVNGISRPWISSPIPLLTSAAGATSAPAQPSRFKCDQCPTTFGKLLTLQYHQSLHSANNPHKCSRCTYAAKTEGGLQSHVLLHEKEDLEKSSTPVFVAPSPVRSPSPALSPKKFIENLGSLSTGGLKKGLSAAIQETLDHPPIKLKFIGLKGDSSTGSAKDKQFKYYIEEQVPLSGVELFKRKDQIEREMPKEEGIFDESSPSGSPVKKEKTDRTGNPLLHYPLHIDRASGRSREKRYKCVLCPSAFDKSDQHGIHTSLHGANYKYGCNLCDYSVRFYANFTMHSKRHKYHDKVDAQRKGLAIPAEDHSKYQPCINANPTLAPVKEKDAKKAKVETVENKENEMDGTLDMTTAEKQQIVLHNKKPDSFKVKDEVRDRQVFYCQYCPYANTRRDAVDSHSLRHKANGGKGIYLCNFCDYGASQPNFIREHTKVHFRTFKYVVPNGFMKHDKQEIWSIESSNGEIDENDDAPKKFLSFSHEDGSYLPVIESSSDKTASPRDDSNKSPEELKKEANKRADSQQENGIIVDIRSGDVVEAPDDIIIALKPSKKGQNNFLAQFIEQQQQLLPNNNDATVSKPMKTRKKRKHSKGDGRDSVPLEIAEEPAEPAEVPEELSETPSVTEDEISINTEVPEIADPMEATEIDSEIEGLSEEVHQPEEVEGLPESEEQSHIVNGQDGEREETPMETEDEMRSEDTRDDDRLMVDTDVDMDEVEPQSDQCQINDQSNTPINYLPMATAISN